MAMDKTKLVVGALLVFTLGVVPKGAFGQAAAEAGLVSGLSSASTTSAASGLSAATNRALQGQAAAVSKVSTPATTPVTKTVVHRTQPTGSKVAGSNVAGSKVSTASTTSGHSGAATANSNGAKLPSGIAHVWPPEALTQEPAPK
jgi:hypothetical protein